MTKIVETLHYDETDDRLHIQRVQDVEPIIEMNKRLYNDNDRHYRAEGLGEKVAEIPLVVIEEYKKKTGIDPLRSREEMRRFLNDPDNRLFRTKPGKV